MFAGVAVAGVVGGFRPPMDYPQQSDDPGAEPMRAGDRVELRSPAEILATLDERGCLDGLPFMPEMLGFFGRPFTVRLS